MVARRSRRSATSLTARLAGVAACGAVAGSAQAARASAAVTAYDHERTCMRSRGGEWEDPLPDRGGARAGTGRAGDPPSAATVTAPRPSLPRVEPVGLHRPRELAALPLPPREQCRHRAALHGAPQRARPGELLDPDSAPAEPRRVPRVDRAQQVGA